MTRNHPWCLCKHLRECGDVGSEEEKRGWVREPGKPDVPCICAKSSIALHHSAMHLFEFKLSRPLIHGGNNQPSKASQTRCCRKIT